MAFDKEEASFAVPILTHTETGIAELMKVDVWRRAESGELIRETTRFALGISRHDAAIILNEDSFRAALDEAHQERLAEASRHDAEQ
jgi:hypothetical protein